MVRVVGKTEQGLRSAKLIKLSAALSTIMLVTACASTSATSAKNPAPISYKAGNVDTAKQLAASARPSHMPYITSPYSFDNQPRAYQNPVAEIPKAYGGATEAQRAQIASNNFDQSRVDTELYAHMRVGVPYEINGKQYTPEHDPTYDKTGIASWYGPKFHGKLTASGETYNKDGLSAAHKTLPLHSQVFVTNLENGKTITLRVNDRGPFVDGRIIDLSEGAAKVLGVAGLAKVRVQYAGPADPNEIGSQQAMLPTPAPVPEYIPAPIETPQVDVPQHVEASPSAPQPQSYQPLSVVPFDLSEASPSPAPVALPQSIPLAPAPLITAPVTPRPVDVEPQAPESTRIAPLAPPTISAPRGRQEFNPPAEGGIMTLTISGPIHLASADLEGQGQVIPALYEGADQFASADQNVHYVQAATFSTMARAQSIKSSLSVAGDVSIHNILRDGRDLHRVLVGPYGTPSEASHALSLIVTLGYADARIVEVY